MGILYSNVPPLRLNNEQQTLSDYFIETAKKSDEIIIAVGYASKKSILELDRIARETKVKNITLVLGMYCVEGFPEGIYNTALQVHRAWKEDGIGEVRAVKSMKYHGKLYAFYKDGAPVSVVIGSHNLGALVTDANNLRQYEISMYSTDKEECRLISEHLKKVSSSPVSEPLDLIANVIIKHSENTQLNGVEGVTKVSAEDVAVQKNALSDITFDIPLKVPGMPGVSQDYMRSNVNKCYAKGRLNSRTGEVKERDWWETEIIVSSTTTGDANYPDADTRFFVITDDGWKFKGHVAGDYKKNFESDGDLKILGYWLKGRLVAAGIVEPIDSPSADLQNKKDSGEDPYKNCRGVITYKKLSSYGRTSLTFTKTKNTLLDDDGTYRDVWLLSFLPENVE